MVNVVDYRLGTISVRDDVAERVIAVCIKCKGFKTGWRTLCASRNWPSLEPGSWRMLEKIICPMCDGQGLFYTPRVSPTPDQSEETRGG